MKQQRYLNKDNTDFIDHCAFSMSTEEFRGAMKFTIGKYIARAGKKDNIVLEIEKIADYAARWLEYERYIENAPDLQEEKE